MDSLYITTPIYYVNDRPHLGHAYASIHADVLARYSRLAGRDVFFLTGADEHGEKIAKAAAANGEGIQDFVDRNADLFMAAWGQLGVEPTQFVRTTLASHKRYVSTALALLYERGISIKQSTKDFTLWGKSASSLRRSWWAVNFRRTRSPRS